jgi:hypothetical protein
MMHNRPEEAASAQCEEKCEGKQPGIAELMRAHERAYDTEHERNNSYNSEDKRQPSEAVTLKIFAFRRR